MISTKQATTADARNRFAAAGAVLEAGPWRIMRRSMKISLVTPAPPRSRKGNRITALRWARILGGLGHRVAVRQSFQRESCDLMLALHARRSHPSIREFHRLRPESPLILAMTGTDLYHDLHRDRTVRQSIDAATRLVVLQPEAISELPPEAGRKARVIYQSVLPPPGRFRPRDDSFEVCVLGHLRDVKDPMRAAQASRLLPPDS